MRTAILVFAAFGLSTVLTAQVNKTAPPGFTTTAGNAYSITFGAYFDERSQVADGNYKGSGFTITELDLRRDEQTPSSYNTIGKTWTNFALSVGDCDYTKLTTTWSTNFLTTPTTLLTGTLTWPSTTTAISNPEPWGDLGTTKGPLRFPFKTPYVYTGKNDLLWEFQLDGGVLENAQPWGGYNKSYYLDGTSNRATIGGGVSVPVPNNDPIMASCAPPGRTTAGYAFLRTVTYAVHNDPNLPPNSSNSYELSFVVRGAPNLTGVVAISPFGTNDIKSSLSNYIGGMNSAGQANIGCMPLGVDLTQPTIFHFCKTGTSTGTSYESTRFYVKYDARLVNNPGVTYGQFAYNHPTSNAFMLTGTGKSLIFAQPVLFPWKSMVIGDYGSGNRGPQPRAGSTPTTTSVPLLGYVTK
jgi:hypothetical protein